jgi:hypothetical protein
LNQAVVSELLPKNPAVEVKLPPTIFANRAGNAIDHHNLLKRQIKPTALALGLPENTDFRSFRTMCSSLMPRTGARQEVTRDMGHVNIDAAQNVYCHSW